MYYFYQKSIPFPNSVNFSVIINKINSVEVDIDLRNRLEFVETHSSTGISTIFNNYLKGVKIWQYQDYSSPLSSNLTITGFFNGSGFPFVSGYIFDSTAVITKSGNVESPPTNTNNILTRYFPSNRVKVVTHTQTNVSLNQSPASGQDCRLWFLVNIPYGIDFPSGYQEAPNFVREDRLEFIDAAYVNQFEDETIYGVKTFDSALVFANPSQTRTNLGLGSAAIREEDFFAAYHELTGASGALSAQITSSDAGVSMVNGLSGIIGVQSTYQTLKIQNIGNAINIESNPNNTQIYRDSLDNITGIYYNNNVGVIKRNGLDQITGVIFNNYAKEIQRNVQDQITGVKITYF